MRRLSCVSLFIKLFVWVGEGGQKKKGGVPIILCVGMPTINSCSMAESRKTVVLAAVRLQPRESMGE